MTKQEIIDSFLRQGILEDVREVYIEKPTSTMEHTHVFGYEKKELRYYYLLGTYDSEEKIGVCIVDVKENEKINYSYTNLYNLKEILDNCDKL